MTPKIDYKLLGFATAQYETRGYKYVEVPWTTYEEAIRATLPKEFPLQKLCVADDDGLRESIDSESCLIGSAEQALITMGLPAGAYMAISPCFRYEPTNDLLHQDFFMKLELFVCGVAEEDAARVVARVMEDAAEVMAFAADIRPQVVQTFENKHSWDLMVGGVEVGSYGYRTCDDFTTPNMSGGIRWVYGTGLALPRFSVAKALSQVCQ